MTEIRIGPPAESDSSSPQYGPVPTVAAERAGEAGRPPGQGCDAGGPVVERPASRLARVLRPGARCGDAIRPRAGGGEGGHQELRRCTDQEGAPVEGRGGVA